MEKKEIAKEILARRNARNNFQDFCKYVYPNYETNWHTEQLCNKLEAVKNGEIKRLMVFMPPRHSKSLHASVLFPAYLLGDKQDDLIVQAGYGDNISKKHSMDCRRIVTDKKFNNLYPNLCDNITEKMKSLTSIREWTTKGGGSYLATSVSGALVGRGANYFFIDDPFRDRAQANSSLQRERVMDWYRSVAYTRLQPDGAIIIINTRWHPEDLCGQLLNDPDGEEWDVLSLPAQKEDEYEALWPERYPKEELMKIKKAIGIQEWTAQYMQEPVNKSGNIFKCNVPENIKIHDSLDEFPNCRYIRAWDMASSIKQRSGNDPDYTVGCLGAVKKDNQGFNHLWIKDLKIFREEAPKRNEIIRTTALYDGGSVNIYIEAFSAYKDAFKELQLVLRGQSIVYQSRLSGDKMVKAAPLEVYFEAGNVHILKGPWMDKFIEQFLNFPLGSHDDVVDAVAIVVGESMKAKAGLLM